MRFRRPALRRRLPTGVGSRLAQAAHDFPEPGEYTVRHRPGLFEAQGVTSEVAGGPARL